MCGAPCAALTGAGSPASVVAFHLARVASYAIGGAVAASSMGALASLAQFSPAGWRISAGTLWLTGGKGQRLSFERNRRGGWDKGPGQGEALSLLPK